MVDVYDNIWEKYVDLYDEFTFDIQEEVLRLFANEAYGNVLDAGCGVGKLFSYLKENERISNICAVEKDVNMFSRAQNKLKDYDDINIFLEDVCSKKFVEIGKNFKANTVISINVLYSLENPILFLKNVMEVLPRRGKFLLSSPSRSVDFRNVLLPHISSKKNLVDGTQARFEEFVKINEELVDTSKDYLKVYSLDEIVSILELLGFEILVKKNSDYLNCNFTIIAQKV